MSLGVGLGLVEEVRAGPAGGHRRWERRGVDADAELVDVELRGKEVAYEDDEDEDEAEVEVLEEEGNTSTELGCVEAAVP